MTWEFLLWYSRLPYLQIVQWLPVLHHAEKVSSDVSMDALSSKRKNFKKISECFSELSVDIIVRPVCV